MLGISIDSCSFYHSHLTTASHHLLPPTLASISWKVRRCRFRWTTMSLLDLTWLQLAGWWYKQCRAMIGDRESPRSIMFRCTIKSTIAYTKDLCNHNTSSKQEASQYVDGTILNHNSQCIAMSCCSCKHQRRNDTISYMQKHIQCNNIIQMKYFTHAYSLI